MRLRSVDTETLAFHVGIIKMINTALVRHIGNGNRDIDIIAVSLNVQRLCDMGHNIGNAVSVREAL